MVGEVSAARKVFPAGEVLGHPEQQSRVAPAPRVLQRTRGARLGSAQTKAPRVRIASGVRWGLKIFRSAAGELQTVVLDTVEFEGEPVGARGDQRAVELLAVAADERQRLAVEGEGAAEGARLAVLHGGPGEATVGPQLEADARPVGQRCRPVPDAV